MNKTWKRLIALVLALVSVLAVTGCGDAGTPTEPSTEPPTEPI